MMLVPSGEFTMGRDEGELDQRPAHLVYLDAYYIDKYEVTNALYNDCVLADICSLPKRLDSRYRTTYYGYPEFDDHPVTNVDYFQATTYCEWRGGNLPTEAQWEKSARGVDQRTYPWGNDFPFEFRANLNGTETTRVGSLEKGASPYGISDYLTHLSLE
jgi:formylglycine-generating enzyme required for sulfatase activity